MFCLCPEWGGSELPVVPHITEAVSELPEPVAGPHMCHVSSKTSPGAGVAPSVVQPLPDTWLSQQGLR